MLSICKKMICTFCIKKSSFRTAPLFLGQRRWKNKATHWSVLERKKYPIDKALEHFDDFYKAIFRSKWPSIRLGLLSPHKYIALLNNFGDIEASEERLEYEGAVNIKKLFDIGKENKNLTLEGNLKHPSVSKLDKVLDEKINISKLETLGNIYSDDLKPFNKEYLNLNASKENDNLEGTNNVKEDYKKAAASLHQSLSEASYDVDRIVDPTINLDGGALHEYVPATKLKGLEDYVSEFEHYSYYKVDTDFPINIQPEFDLEFPEHLKIFSFPTGTVTSFPQPRRGKLGVFDYYLMDGASVLPVLALGIKLGDRCLDMCAAPGGKSLTALQTLYLSSLVCNDISGSRRNRMELMFRDYIFNFADWNDRLHLTVMNGCHIMENNTFDKILVDVPCTNDRHSVMVNDNSIFRQDRIKERLKLPEIQSDLLTNALKLVHPGGSVVYSTCSLSPIQNDGVVHMALKRVWEETKMEFVVKDLTPALDSTTSFFQYAGNIGLKFGHLVVPFIPCNFGPMYFCKIDKIR